VLRTAKEATIVDSKSQGDQLREVCIGKNAFCRCEVHVIEMRDAQERCRRAGKDGRCEEGLGGVRLFEGVENRKCEKFESVGSIEEHTQKRNELWM
jgi:hypothetical protein